MPKQDKKLTPHQMGIIKRYYEHKEDIAHQNLSEIVSDLYLERNPNRRLALWRRIEKALENAGAQKEKIAELVKNKDVNALAEYVNDSF